MNKLCEIFKDAIAGSMEGFDRLMFHGKLANLIYSGGAEKFFGNAGILFKDAKTWIEKQTRRLISDADKLSKQLCGCGIIPIRSSHERKDAIVEARIAETGITTGLVGIWSCTEECKTFRLIPAPEHPILRAVTSRCLHLYGYWLHPQFGLIGLRLQTWFPYQLQVSMNGRLWMSRQLEIAKVAHTRHGNKILSCDDFAKAQALLDAQALTHWALELDKLVPLIFPAFADVLGPGYRYTWYSWQSEWATDLVFRKRDDLLPLGESLIVHAILSGHSDAIMRFFDKGVNSDGMLRRDANPKIVCRTMHFADGVRIRYECHGNSAKAYIEYSTLRIENTVNRPAAFLVARGDKDAKGNAIRKPLRKNVSDLHLRAKIGVGINHRVADSLANLVEKKIDVETVLSPVTSRIDLGDGRHARALDPLGKDRRLLQAVAQPQFAVDGFANADIRSFLAQDPRHKDKSEKQLSAATSRALKVLREHGLIIKLPGRHRYQLTDKGAALTSTVNSILHADLAKLAKCAA
jgi:hypothetical protein